MVMKILFSQIKALTLANLKTRYRGTVSGFLWVIINPVLLYGAQSFAFHYILKIKVENYPLFLLSGLLPWIFIVQCLEMCTPVFVNSGRLMKSFPIRPFAFMMATILDNLINFLAAFFIILIPVAWGSEFNFLNLLFLPLPAFILLLSVLSLSWILATMNVFFRDLKFIVSFVTSVAFFVTPIFYPESFVPEKYRWVLDYNIFAHIISPFREAILDPYSTLFVKKCVIGLCLSFLLLTFALIIWRRKKNAFYYRL